MQPNTKAALFYITSDTCAFLPLEIHSLHGIKLTPPTYQPVPEAPMPEALISRTPSISSERVQTILPEASFLIEARSIRSSNAKARMAWAQKIEKEIAPQILRQLGFTNIQPGNGRPVDVEAWYHRTRYLIDVKYIAQMPSIIRKLATLIMNYPLPEVALSRVRRRKTKESN